MPCSLVIVENREKGNKTVPITEQSFRDGGFHTSMHNTRDGRFVDYGSLCGPSPSESVWMVPGTECDFVRHETT
jgi:hypothetical protein